jgi:hypothetical protein
MAFRTHYLSPSAVDYSDTTIKRFISDFRGEFNNEPNDYAMIGYDIAYQFISAMMCFGDTWESCVDDYHPELLRSKYVFRRIPEGGFENIYWNIARYGNFEVVPIQNEYDFSRREREDN